MRYVATFLIKQANPRIWWQEVAQIDASGIFVSDCNIPNENKHPNSVKSMLFTEISYSYVSNCQKSNLSALIIFPPHLIGLI